MKHTTKSLSRWQQHPETTWVFLFSSQFALKVEKSTSGILEYLPGGVLNKTFTFASNSWTHCQLGVSSVKQVCRISLLVYSRGINDIITALTDPGSSATFPPWQTPDSSDGGAARLSPSTGKPFTDTISSTAFNTKQLQSVPIVDTRCHCWNAT